MGQAMDYSIINTPPSSLPSQPWWPTLHPMINQAFLSKDHSVFPPSWTRLNSEPTKGANGLIHELGDKGIFLVVFGGDGRPVACSGALPFRGENWINDVDGKHDADSTRDTQTAASDLHTSNDLLMDIPDWEICCFCVDPSERKRGLARRLLKELEAVIKPKGAKRLISNYAVDETGDFWSRLGFDIIPGAGGMLPKGFQTDPSKEGLRADVHFKMGAKQL